MLAFLSWAFLLQVTPAVCRISSSHHKRCLPFFLIVIHKYKKSTHMTDSKKSTKTLNPVTDFSTGPARLARVRQKLDCLTFKIISRQFQNNSIHNFIFIFHPEYKLLKYLKLNNIVFSKLICTFSVLWSVEHFG